VVHVVKLHRAAPMEMRPATPDDAPAILATVAEGFDGYREWAPDDWSPPGLTPAVLARVRARLSDAQFWYLVALDRREMAGHVALAPATVEEPAPPPPGETYLAQMFVRRPWQGSGVAAALMAAAVAEAGGRGFAGLRLWTPQGAARARRFYEREGWTATGEVHAARPPGGGGSPSGLDTMEYVRAVVPAPRTPS